MPHKKFSSIIFNIFNMLDKTYYHIKKDTSNEVFYRRTPLVISGFISVLFIRSYAYNNIKLLSLAWLLYNINGGEMTKYTTKNLTVRFSG